MSARSGEVIEVVLVGGVVVAPVGVELLEPGLQQPEGLAFERQIGSAADLASLDQPCAFEDSDVLVDRWKGKASLACELTDGGGLEPQEPDDVPTVRIGQGIEDLVESLVVGVAGQGSFTPE